VLVAGHAGVPSLNQCSDVDADEWLGQDAGTIIFRGFLYSLVMHRATMLIKTCLLIASAMTLAACSTGVFLRPSAESGFLVKENAACPGPAQVIQFTPKNTDWVHLRIYAIPINAAPPYPSKSQTWLVIEIQTQVGLGLPRSEWKGDEFKRRSKHKFEFRAENPEVILVYPDGRERTFLVSLFAGAHSLQSETILLASEKIGLGEILLDGFVVRMPSVYIDGEEISIPPIRFSPDKEHYVPVLNC
jgi:hypothetical protein